MAKKTTAQKKAARRAAAASASAASTNGENDAGAGSSAPSSPEVTTNDLPKQNGHAKAEEQEERPLSAEEIKEKGNIAFKAGRYDEAVRLYTEAITADPSNPAYLTNRAAASMAQRRFKPALADCESALALGGSSDKVLLRLARCQLALGLAKQAQGSLAQVQDAAAVPLRKQAERVVAAVRRYEAERARKEWGMAGLALREAEREAGCEPGDAPLEWKVGRVECLLGKGDTEEAGRLVSDLLAFSGNSPDLLLLRARVLFLDSQFLKAIAHLQSALRFDPDFLPARELLKRVRVVERGKEAGNAVFKAGRWEEAVEKYGEALGALLESGGEVGEGKVKAVLLSNRATAYSKMPDRTDLALADASAALALHPTYTKALRTRARIYLATEQFEDAVRDFKAAAAAATGADERRALEREAREAELELKKSKRVDHYKILGIEKTATEIEIKKAYRRESLKAHPDKPGGDEEKFKIVAEAYNVLSDPVARRRFDSGADLEEDDPFGGMGGSPFGGGVDLSDILFSMGGGGMGGGGMGGGGMGGGGMGGGRFGGGMGGGGFGGGGFPGGGGGGFHFHSGGGGRGGGFPF